MKVDISTKDNVKDVECINCNKCVSRCPEKSLSIKTFNKKYPIGVYIFLVVATFFLVIGGSMAMGIWESVQSLEEYDHESSITGDDLKGWMTIKEVADSSGYSSEEILVGIGFGDIGIDSSVPMKEISKTYNISFETELVRAFIDGREPVDHEE